MNFIVAVGLLFSIKNKTGHETLRLNVYGIIFMGTNTVNSTSGFKIITIFFFTRIDALMILDQA